VWCVECEVWSGKWKVLGVEWKVWTVEWKVLSVNCSVVTRRNVKFTVLILECRACHVAYEVCSAECERESCCYSVCLVGRFRLQDCPVKCVECRLQSAEWGAQSKYNFQHILSICFFLSSSILWSIKNHPKSSQISLVGYMPSICGPPSYVSWFINPIGSIVIIVIYIYTV